MASSHHGYGAEKLPEDHKTLSALHQGLYQGHPTLYDQISGYNAAHKEKKIQWMKECQEAFDMLKVRCTSAPILAFADFMKPFTQMPVPIGLGAILYQKQFMKD